MTDTTDVMDATIPPHRFNARTAPDGTVTLLNHRDEPIPRLTSTQFVPLGMPIAAPSFSGPAPNPAWLSYRDTAKEAQLLAALNRHRVSIHVNPLVIDPVCQAAIAFYVLLMAAYAFMAHDSPDGIPGYPATTFQQRMVSFGINQGYPYGENLAYGFTDVDAVVAAWLSDIGHRQNIENPGWVGVGCGWAIAPAGSLGGQLTADLAFQGNDFSGEPAAPAPPPAPPPSASLLQQWQSGALPHLQDATVTWRNWHRTHPAEYQAVTGWIANPVGPPPTSVTSAFGLFVLGTAQLLHTTAV